MTIIIKMNNIEYKRGSIPHDKKIMFKPADEWKRSTMKLHDFLNHAAEHIKKLKELNSLPLGTQIAISKSKPDGPRLGKNGKMKILLALMNSDRGMTKKEIARDTALSDSAVHCLIRKMKPNIVKAGKSRKCSVGTRQTVTWDLVE